MVTGINPRHTRKIPIRAMPTAATFCVRKRFVNTLEKAPSPISGPAVPAPNAAIATSAEHRRGSGDRFQQRAIDQPAGQAAQHQPGDEPGPRPQQPPADPRNRRRRADLDQPLRSDRPEQDQPGQNHEHAGHYRRPVGDPVERHHDVHRRAQPPGNGAQQGVGDQPTRVIQQVPLDAPRAARHIERQHQGPAHLHAMQAAGKAPAGTSG